VDSNVGSNCHAPSTLPPEASTPPPNHFHHSHGWLLSGTHMRVGGRPEAAHPGVTGTSSRDHCSRPNTRADTRAPLWLWHRSGGLTACWLPTRWWSGLTLLSCRSAPFAEKQTFLARARQLR
jgi:hypothetical protein